MKAKVLENGKIIEVKKEKLSRFYSASDGNHYWDTDLELLPDTPEEAVIEGWVARDKNGSLFFHALYPTRYIFLESWGGGWKGDYLYFQLPTDSFPSVTWRSEPKEVRITITPIEE